MQHYHRPRAVRKLRQRFLQPLSQLAVFGRIAKGTRNRIRQFLGGPHFSTPCQVECRVRHDPIEPRAETLARIESVERLIRAQETFLNRILGVLMRHYDRPGNEIRPSLMQMHEAGEAPFIPCLGQTNEPSLLIRNTHRCGQSLTG